MLRFILKRFISGLVVLFLFQSLLFFVVQIVLPGDYVSQFAMFLSDEESAEMRHALGLDLPLGQRYLNWVGSVVLGKFGNTFSLSGVGEPVDVIVQRVVPPTILVFGVGTALAFLIGLWLGKITAWRGPGLVSGTVTFSSIALYTSFPPWLGFLLIYFITTQLNLLPGSFDRKLWMDAEMNTSQVMVIMVQSLAVVLGLLLLLSALFRRLTRKSIPVLLFLALTAACWYASWIWLGIATLALDVTKAAALPLLGYVLLSFGEIVLITRTTMLDVMHEQYVYTGRAKGLTSNAVRDRHVVRNAILPVLSGLVVRLPYLFTGAVMLEKALNWEGMGSTLFQAVGMQNIMLVLDLVLVIGMISLVARLVLDILQALLDPRLRQRHLTARGLLQ